MNTNINYLPRRCEALLRNCSSFYDAWHALFLLLLLLAMPVRTLADNITFADQEVKRICVNNWDTNGDGELSEEEAVVVTDLGRVFWSSKITSFKELQHFTGLTSIGESTFFSCSSLTEVTIPYSITSIRRYAFSGCSGLTAVHISDLAAWCNIEFEGNYSNPLSYAHHLYLNGSEIKKLVIPNGVTSLGNYAFYGCSDLKTVTIPTSVKSIGYNAFDGCSGLTAVYISDLAAWCKIEFESSYSNPLSYAHCLYLNGLEIKELSIPNSITTIGDYAFEGCSSLTSVTIHNSVTSIGSYAFSICSGLTAVYISDLAAWCKIEFESRYSNPLSYAHRLYLNGSEIKELVIPNDIKAVGDYAFEGCSGLTTVVIPNSVTSIGEGAFRDCSELTAINIPNSVTSIGRDAFAATLWYKIQPSGLIYAGKVVYEYKGTMPNNTHIIIKEGTIGIAGGAFSSCSGMTAVTIPSSVNSIGNSAFSGCSGLTAITIPNSVTSIGDYAFQYCRGLTSVSIPNSVTSIGNSVFSSCSGLTAITIPNSVTSIGSHAFDGCSGLMAITIPNSVTSIGSHAFYHCRGFTSVTIPNSVTSIGSHAFYECSGLTAITIPNSVTSIGSYAFYGCSGLTSVTIGNSVTSIGESAFNQCHGLKAVYISDLAPWCKIEFTQNDSNPLRYAEHLYLNGSEIKELVIPSSVTSIGNYAFGDCKGLTSVTIGNSVTSIGNYAFGDCSGLISVTIGNSVTSIGDHAFSLCTNLTSVTIPNSVTNIGYSAFQNCYHLTEVTIGNSVMSIGNYAFYDCSGLKAVTIPSSVTTIGDYAFYDSNSLKTVVSEIQKPFGIANRVFDGNTYYGTLIVPFKTKEKYMATDGWSKFKNIKENDTSDIISFNDKEVKRICVENWDRNGDGELSVLEAADVTGLESVFYKQPIKSFEELKFFTGLFGLGDYAFYHCNELTSIALPDNITTIGNSTFKDCSSLLSITIPSGVTSIGEGAFLNCSSLSSIALPDNITTIGNSTFDDCSSLSSIIIPNGVTIIGDFAFSDCSSLTSITIPCNVSTIGKYAFSDCLSLTTVKSEVETPFAIEKNVFGSETYAGSLLVPYGKINAYKNTDGWNLFQNIDDGSILELSLEEIEINVGESFSLKVTKAPEEMASSAVWNSSDESVATVSEEGIVTGVAAGTADIIVTISTGKTATCHVTVKKNTQIESISLGQTETTIKVGETATLTATLTPSDAENQTVAWTSDNETVASVTGDGLTATIAGNGMGTATITATTGNGLMATCHVTVVKVSKKQLVLTPNIRGGEVTGGMEVTLSVSDEDGAGVNDADIYYTTDTSEPTKESTRYDGPIVIERSMLLRAVAMKEGYETSNELQESYTVVADPDVDSEWTDESLVVYGFNTSGTTAKVTQAKSNAKGNVTIRERFTFGGREYVVTEVAKNAFSGAQDVVSVSVPSSVITVGEKAFGNGHLLSLVWLPATKLPADALPEEGERSRNFLIYVNNGDIVPRAVTNTCHVAVLSNDGTYRSIKAVVLADGEDFCCPLPFRADVSYTHRYQMATGLNSCEGWETLSLPFDVETVSHADGRMLLPFGNSLSGGERPFWLYALTTEGFVKTRQVRANTPYIISMPNNESYLPDYRLAGAVTFAATDAEVQPTETAEGTTLEGKGTFRAVYRTLRSSETVACLNSVNDQHTATGDETPGSHFMTNLRATAPFEAVFMNASAGVRSFAIAFARQDTDAISDLTLLQGRALKGIYNLQGQRLSQAPRFSDHAPLRKGVYVVGGKKVVVK